MAILSEFGQSNTSYSFQKGGAGTIAGSVTRTRLPDIPSEMVMFKARSTNTGKVYIGESLVTSNNGYELGAGEQTAWIPVVNLNVFYYIFTVAADKLDWILVRSG